MNHDFVYTKADINCFAASLLGIPTCSYLEPCFGSFMMGGGGGQGPQSMQGGGDGGEGSGADPSFEGYPQQYADYLNWLLDHPRGDYLSMSDQEYEDWIGDVGMEMIFGVPMP